jgi:hypothetical protein
MNKIKYCIIGFEYDDPINYSEFFQDINKYGILETTDDWEKAKTFDELVVADDVRNHLKEDFTDYGWYVLIINKL